MLFYQLLQKCDQEDLIENRAWDKTASWLLYFELSLDRQEVWKKRKALLWQDCHSPRWRGRLKKTWDLMLDEHRLETLFAWKDFKICNLLIYWQSSHITKYGDPRSGAEIQTKSTYFCFCKIFNKSSCRPLWLAVNDMRIDQVAETWGLVNSYSSSI